jgi:hypothetical protein
MAKCHRSSTSILEKVLWPGLPMNLPDLIRLQRSSRVSNIRTFVHISGAPISASEDIAAPRDGLSAAERAANPYQTVAVVTFDDGIVSQGVSHSVNGYIFTSQGSVLAARRVLAGAFEAGFQTPAQLFGKAFLSSVPGCNLMQGRPALSPDFHLVEHLWRPSPSVWR